MSEIRRQPSTPRGSSVAKKRMRVPETKNNSVQATLLAIGSSGLTFMNMFNFEVQSFRCGKKRFGYDRVAVCDPFGISNADVISILLYSGIVLGVVSLVMIVLVFMLKLQDFPRWTVTLFRYIFLAVIVVGFFCSTRRY